jgi:hypothetical protein
MHAYLSSPPLHHLSSASPPLLCFTTSPLLHHLSSASPPLLLPSYYKKARIALSPKNIIAGYDKTGIHPFDPSRAIPNNRYDVNLVPQPSPPLNRPPSPSLTVIKDLSDRLKRRSTRQSNTKAPDDSDLLSAAYNELTRTRAELEMLRRAETAREAADQEARERKRRKKDRIESKPRNYRDPANVELLRKQREEQEEKGKRKGKRNGMGRGKGKGKASESQGQAQTGPAGEEVEPVQGIMCPLQQFEMEFRGSWGQEPVNDGSPSFSSVSMPPLPSPSSQPVFHPSYPLYRYSPLPGFSM